MSKIPSKEPGDKIWSLHSKINAVIEESGHPDIRRVLRLAVEALGAAGAMADRENMKGRGK